MFSCVVLLHMGGQSQDCLLLGWLRSRSAANFVDLLSHSRMISYVECAVTPPSLSFTSSPSLQHFRCPICHKQCATTGALAVHCHSVHKEVLTEVPGSVDDRKDIKLEVFGMSGYAEAMFVVTGGGSARASCNTSPCLRLPKWRHKFWHRRCNSSPTGAYF